MSSPTHRDPAHVRDNNVLVSCLGLMAENLLTDTWDLVTDNNYAGRFAKLTTKDAELSSQLTEIILCINDIEIKIDREGNLQALIRRTCKDFTDQRRRLMIWLQLHELADELEDACLAGDSKLSILVALETDSVLRWIQSSAYNELVYKLCLMDSNERMTT